MGFDWVFVNPIQKLGRSGSLYSISDYLKINPALLKPRAGKLEDEPFLQSLPVYRYLPVIRRAARR